jgi:hypothetical protein
VKDPSKERINGIKEGVEEEKERRNEILKILGKI